MSWDSHIDRSAAPNASYVDGIVSALAADGAGGWYIGGRFTSVNDVLRHNLAHIKADLSLDSSWSPDISDLYPERHNTLHQQVFHEYWRPSAQPAGRN